MIQMASMLFDVLGAGCVQYPGMAQDGGDAASVDFDHIVDMLLGKMSAQVEEDVDQAGQQAQSKRDEQPETADQLVGADVQAQCLLRSMATPAEPLTVAPVTTEVPILPSVVSPTVAEDAQPALMRESPVADAPMQPVLKQEDQPAERQVKVDIVRPQAPQAAVNQVPVESSPRPTGLEHLMRPTTSVEPQHTAPIPVQPSVAVAESQTDHPVDRSSEVVFHTSDPRGSVRAESVEYGATPPVQPTVVTTQTRTTSDVDAQILGTDTRTMSDGAAELGYLERESGQDDGRGGDMSRQSLWTGLGEIKAPVQQKIVDAASVVPTDHPHTIGAKVINQIVRSAKVELFDGGGQMTLRLDPPHLGQLSMQVATADGKVTADIQASTAAARQILQSELENLKQSLADAGVRIDSISVSVSADPGHGHQGHSEAYDRSAYRSVVSGASRAAHTADPTGSVQSAVTVRSGGSSQIDYMA